MDLHPEEAALSGDEDEEQEHSDQDLQIRRTVTQVRRQLFNSFISASGSFYSPSQMGRKLLNFQVALNWLVTQFLSLD